jgi:TolB protein
LTQLTTGGGNIQPTLSPDGKWVVYTGNRGGNSSLWRTSIEGGKSSPLTTDETSWATISPDGRFIACAYGKTNHAFDQRIAVYPFEGGAALKIFTAARNSLLDNRLRWSPDGKSIIYKDRIHGLWQQDLNREKPVLINGFDEIKFYHFGFFPETRDFIYSGGSETREIIIAENFS